MLTKHFTFRNGSSRAIHEAATRLSARGHEVHIFCNRRPVRYYDGAPVLRHVPMWPLGSWGRVLSFDWGCRRRTRVERFDIIHGHGNTTEQDVVTVHVCRKANRLARGLSLSGRDSHLFIERRQFENRRLKRIIVFSGRLKQDLERLYGIPPERVVTIPNGVDANRFHPRLRSIYRERVRQEVGLSNRDLAVLFVASGNFENRGLPNLLSAVARRTENRVRLIVVGGDRLGPYRERARRLGIEDRLIFLPFTERLEELHAGADALVFPSYYDTFGSVPLEAMASGLPVIVTESCGMSELIVDGVNGLILKDPSDIGALDAALARLSDDDLRERLGRKARETAERQSWDTVADRTIKVYEELLAERS
ncbi:MAG: glycosyltransferase family 4 protein [Nitrospirae bacterium]|nr:glycosyltransferase family 4 protein [Nitrospirota bacterium]